jgi:hypothetical protein
MGFIGIPLSGKSRVLFISDWQVSAGSQSLRRHRRLKCLNKSATPDSKCILFYINRMLRPPFKLSDNSVSRAAPRISTAAEKSEATADRPA